MIFVLMTWPDSGEVLRCTLESFLAENDSALDEDERMRLLAGESIALGGGAVPRVRVEVVP